MMTIEAFKDTDTLEAKVRQVFLPKLEELGVAHDDFYNGAFDAFPLGDVLWEAKVDPIAEAIIKDVYRTAFAAIHALSDTPATFQSWISIFTAVWGETGAVRFVVPAPGKLEINIDGFLMKDFEAATDSGDNLVTTGDLDTLIFRSYVRTIEIVGFDWLAREIIDNVVVRSNMVDHDGNQIEFQSFDPRLSQAEATQFVFQLSAYGIYTTINLNFLNA